MANEARLNVGLTLRVGNLKYQSQPSSFTADVAVAGGPSPGQVLVLQAGTDIDLSLLTSPGLCRIQNLDDTNYVSYGIWDHITLRFYYLGELLPGESYILRLSRWLGNDTGTGTGTGALASGERLRFKAHGAACKVLVEAFES